MLHIHGGAWIMGAPEMNDIVNLDAAAPSSASRA